jgi:hypothetical protein
MEKRTVLSVGDKKTCEPTKNNILVHANKMSMVSSICGAKPSYSRCCAGDILSEKNKWENETLERVKWSKGAKLEDLEDVLVIWTAVK